MSWTNRVVWQEGMFLRTQHFQQQDRWLEMLVRGRTAALRPHPWGLTECAIDRDLLGTGRFALASAAGVFEDGTPFSLPGETDHPPPLDLPDSARNVAGLSGAADPPGGRGRGRATAAQRRPLRACATSRRTTPIRLRRSRRELQVGRLRLRYLLETEERAGYHCIGLARDHRGGRRRRVSARRTAGSRRRWSAPPRRRWPA